MVDRVIFVCTLVLAAIYFYATSTIPSLEIGDPLGPKAFPRLLGIALLVTAGILFLEILRARKVAPVQEASPEPGDRNHYYVILGVVAWTAAYLSIFELAGYVIATSIYLFGLMSYFHKGHALANGLTSVLFCLLGYLMFTKLLGVTLARGVLPF